MAQVQFFRVSALPATPVVGGIYYLKQSGNSFANCYLGVSGGFVPMRGDDAVKTVNSLNGNVQLEVTFSNGQISITGGQTSINLDSRYYTQAQITTFLEGKADDTSVVHKTGAESIAGVKTFGASPVVPDATTATQATNYGQLQAVKNALESQISALQSGVTNRIFLDASTNPNYPAMSKSDVVIITGAGKIGGASGLDVNIGDSVYSKIDSNPGGTQSAVGSNYQVIASNEADATETVKGEAMIATNAEAIAGTNDSKIMTPLKVKAAISSQAVNKSGAESISGVKTFSDSPVVPTATSDNQAVNKAQVASMVAAAQTSNVPTLDQVLNSGNTSSRKATFGSVGMPNKAGTDVSVADTTVFSAGINGGLKINANVGGQTKIIDVSTELISNGMNYTQKLPNKSGTFAMLDDLSAVAGNMAWVSEEW